MKRTWQGLWYKIIFQTKSNGASYLYLYPFGDLVQFKASMEPSMCPPIMKYFLIYVWIMSQLGHNYEWIKS
jgi:hypothetical protein